MPKRYIRKHWIVLLSHVWWMPLTPVALVFGWQIFLAVMLLTALRLWWVYTDWRNDMYVLGDGKLVAITKTPLGMNQELDPMALSNINSAEGRISGLWQRMLKCGYITINMSNANDGRVLGPVARPIERAEMIMDYRNQGMRAVYATSAD